MVTIKDIGENSILTCDIMIMASDINKEGEIGTLLNNITFQENKHFYNVEKFEEYINSLGFNIEDFKRFNSEDEPTRLNYQYEEENTYYDIDLYLEIYNRDLDNDYLSNFEEY